MGICYYCGEIVLTGKGAREHIVPKTLLKDVDGNWADFIISKENAHQKCNKFLADNYEHDFCQILFNYSIDDKNAQKHVESKKRNLKSRLEYAKNQFSKMKLVGNLTQVTMTEEEKNSFKEILLKIIMILLNSNKKNIFLLSNYGNMFNFLFKLNNNINYIINTTNIIYFIV